MGRTNWKRFSLILLMLVFGPGCRDRNAPEISVRNPTPINPTADQTKQPPMVSKLSVITIGAPQDWALVLITLQDAESGAIKFAETLPYSSLAPSLEVPYGSYFITVEFFLDAAKTQSLARSCEADRTRIHTVNQGTYSVVPTLCPVNGTGPESAASDIVIRPVVIQN